MSKLLFQRVLQLCAFLLTASIPMASHGASTYLTGNIYDYSSTKYGIQIRLDTGVPDLCAGIPYGWMKISEDDPAMISTFLTIWMANQRHVTVYVDSTSSSSSCTVNQLDPHDQ